MSQAGLIDIESSHPTIPTQFDGDSGSAIPIGNLLEVKGNTVVSSTYVSPIFVTASGNTVTINTQVGKDRTGAPTNSNDAGLASFDDTFFTQDANGYVTFIGAGFNQTITGDTGGALSPTAGNWNIISDDNLETSGSSSTLTIGMSTTISPEIVNLTAITAPSHAAGQLFYDTDTDSLSFHNSESDITLQIGEENWIKVRNETGATITNGTIVYLNGTSSDMPLIMKAQANAESTQRTLGVVTHSIEDSSNGFVTTFGLVRGLNTSAFTGGDIIYLSPTVAGGATTTKPTGNNYIVRIGYIAAVDASDGTFLVNVENGGDTSDIAGVAQENIVYVGKHGDDSHSGLDIGQAKLTIQAALDVAGAGATIAINPGTYTESVSFTANNQTLYAVGKPNNVIITQADANVVDFGTYTGCVLYNLQASVTAATTAIATITGSTGSLKARDCVLRMTTTTSITSASQPSVASVTGAGSFKLRFSQFHYANSGDGGATAQKAAFYVADGGEVDLKLACCNTITTSGTDLVTSTAVDTASTGIIKMSDCAITMVAGGAISAGLAYIGGTGTDHEFYRNTLELDATGCTNAYGLFAADTATTTRSFYNHLHILNATNNYSFYIASAATLISHFDDIVAADGSVIAGTFNGVSSPEDGDLVVTGKLEVGADAIGTASATTPLSVQVDSNTPTGIAVQNDTDGTDSAATTNYQADSGSVQGSVGTYGPSYTTSPNLDGRMMVTSSGTESNGIGLRYDTGQNLLILNADSIATTFASDGVMTEHVGLEVGEDSSGQLTGNWAQWVQKDIDDLSGILIKNDSTTDGAAATVYLRSNYGDTSINMYDDSYTGVSVFSGKFVINSEGDGAVINYSSDKTFKITRGGDTQTVFNATATGVCEMNEVGIGTSTVPHGGVGAALFAIDGTVSNSSGPHIQYTVSSDDYPVFSQLNWSHDNIQINFDCYYGATGSESSDAGSNFRITKGDDALSILVDEGVAAGSSMSMEKAFNVDKYGHITMPMQSAFLAYNSATDANVTGNGTDFTCSFDTEIFDQNSDYNSSTYTYTAPTSMKMVNFIELSFYNTSGTTIFDAWLATSNRTYRIAYHGDISSQGATKYIACNAAHIVDYDAGDTGVVHCSITGLGSDSAAFQGNPGCLSSFGGSIIC